MILVFILLLAFLADAIAREVDRTRRRAAPVVPETCPDCRGEASSDWLYCPRCRRPLRRSCPACGRIRVAAHRFCVWCGMAAKGGGQ